MLYVISIGGQADNIRAIIYIKLLGRQNVDQGIPLEYVIAGKCCIKIRVGASIVVKLRRRSDCESF